MVQQADYEISPADVCVDGYVIRDNVKVHITEIEKLGIPLLRKCIGMNEDDFKKSDFDWDEFEEGMKQVAMKMINQINVFVKPRQFTESISRYIIEQKNSGSYIMFTQQAKELGLKHGRVAFFTKYDKDDHNFFLSTLNQVFGKDRVFENDIDVEVQLILFK